MNEPRKPGEVHGETVPIDDSDVADALRRAHDEHAREQEPGAGGPRINRKPGQVFGPTEPMPPEEPATPDLPPVSLEPPPKSTWFSVFWLLLACIGLWGLASGLSSLADLWQQQWPVAVALGLAGALLAGLLARAMWLEWLAMRDVDALAERRALISEALDSNDIIALRAAIEPTLRNLSVKEKDLIDEFEAAVVDTDDCQDYVQAFENLVLHSLDEKAQTTVQNGAIATAAAVAIVPHPAFDAIVVLWRSLVMTRAIGTIYGLRPGGLASWRLFTHSLKSALLAAGVETLTSIVADATASSFARVLKPLAEGGVIGIRVYHFGRLTVGACRPLIKQV